MVKSFRETYIQDILDLVQDVQDINSGVKSGSKFSKKNAKGLNVSSISRASKDLIMTFPVLCDNSLDPRTAAMICKAVERKAVTMLQLIFSSNVFKANSGAEVIKSWHNNIDDGDLTLDDYMDLCDRFTESYKETTDDKRFLREGTEQIKREMREGYKFYPNSSFSEHSVNDYKVITRFGEAYVTEAPVRPDGTIFPVDDYPDDYVPDDSDVRMAQFHKNIRDIRKTQVDIDRADLANSKTRQDIRKTSLDMRRTNQDMAKSRQDMRDKDLQWRYNSAYGASKMDNDANLNFFNKQLLDTDVKKCNELVPSLMVIRFVDSNNNDLEAQFVAGVKARLTSIDSMDIINHVAAKHRDRAGLLNFVKATTKEISFVKDYLLAIDKAKLDAKNNSIRNGSSSRIWKTLEKRSNKSVWKRIWGKSNDAGCITTLVVSQEVANVLKKDYGVNLANPKVASGIMDSYNLLALVIVDTSTEVARFLYDGDSSYEDLSFDSLERESGDGSYKKVINLLTKMNK